MVLCIHTKGRFFKMAKNKKKVEKKKRSPQEVQLNIIIAVVIAAVVALAAWAVVPKIMANRAANQPAQTQQEQPTTLAQVASQMGKDVDTFKADYGITADAETPMEQVQEGMTLDNFLKMSNDLNGDQVLFDELLANYGVTADQVTPETTMKQLYDMMPISAVLENSQFDTDIASMIKEAGLGDDVTEKSSWAQYEEQLTPILYQHMIQPSEAPAEAAPAEEASSVATIGGADAPTDVTTETTPAE